LASFVKLCGSIVGLYLVLHALRESSKSQPSPLSPSSLTLRGQKCTLSTSGDGLQIGNLELHARTCYRIE
jgi:hypothetical protein